MLLDKVRTVAKEKGMTLKAVAEKAEINYDTMMSWKDHNPGALAVWKVSKALDIPVVDLLDEIKEK